MLNVCDIKSNRNLNFILPLDGIVSNKELRQTDILIVIHLYYTEKIQKYLNYIKDIPDYVSILFVTPNPQIKIKIDEYLQSSNKTYQVIKKENRGRDISGLLVACRKQILQHRYVCFLHDKKEKSERTKRDTDIFETCLWENMVGSVNYINNIIEKFEENPELGVLLPPESISDSFSFFFKNTWDKDFELMCSLAKKLDLKCDLNKDKKPLSLGTVFWARVQAIKKLLEVQWQYEDFDEEPLASDGTISHVIERCFAYVAQDAGYDTGIVMTDRFAGQRMDYLQEIMTQAFERLEESLDISTVGHLKKVNLIYKELIKFAEQYSSVYIYGAGNYGKYCAKLLKAAFCQIKGFIVSNADENEKQVGDIPVISVSELDLVDSTGVIIAVSEKYKLEIEKKLKEKFPYFTHVFYFDL